ncbi:MAG: ComEA family DNA-binding protein [Candidatus Tyrphobacter sp.]
MYRYALLAGGVVLAALALFHPVPRPPQALPAPEFSVAPLARSLPARRRFAYGSSASSRGRCGPSRRRSRRRARHRRQPVGVVDLNTAGAQALGLVPGIGAAIAQRIVDVRASEGPFTSLDQLLDVAGMTSSRLDRAQQYLRL